MSIGQICGLAILCAALALLLKTAGAKPASAIPLTGGVLLSLFSLYRYEKPIATLLQLAEEAGVSASLGAILKMLAVGCLTTLAADICRDMGELSLGARVEACGRAEILLLCLPFITELFTLAWGLVE